MRVVEQRLAMLVDALAPAREAILADQLRRTAALALSVGHTATGIRVEGEVCADGGPFKPRAAWDLAPAALRLRPSVATPAPGLPPPPAPAVPLPLLPDARTLSTACSCGRLQPCAHALALLLALGTCLERQPGLLYRDGRARVEPGGPAARAPARTTAPAVPAAPGAPRAPADGFWTFAAPPPDVPLIAPSGPPSPGLPLTRVAASRPDLAAGLQGIWHRTRAALRASRERRRP